MRENRRHARYEINKPAWYLIEHGENTRFDFVHIRNISQGGVYFLSDERLDPGQTLRLFLRYEDLDDGNAFTKMLPDNNQLYFKLSGQVVRVEELDRANPRNGIAIQLAGPVTLIQNHLHGLTEEQIHRDSRGVQAGGSETKSISKGNRRQK